MFKQSEHVKYTLLPEEQFDAAKGRGDKAVPFRVETLERWVSLDYAPLLSAHGPRILKDGSLGAQRIGGSFNTRYGSTSIELPAAIRAELEKVGFFDGAEVGD